jgi:hypothetical protein
MNCLSIFLFELKCAFVFFIFVVSFESSGQEQHPCKNNPEALCWYDVSLPPPATDEQKLRGIGCRKMFAANFNKIDEKCWEFRDTQPTFENESQFKKNICEEISTMKFCEKNKLNCEIGAPRIYSSYQINIQNYKNIFKKKFDKNVCKK